MTLIPNLTLPNNKMFPWSICKGCAIPAGNTYPSEHLVPPFLGLECSLIVETSFLQPVFVFMTTFHFEYFSVLSRFNFIGNEVWYDNSSIHINWFCFKKAFFDNFARKVWLKYRCNQHVLFTCPYKIFGSSMAKTAKALDFTTDDQFRCEFDTAKWQYLFFVFFYYHYLNEFLVCFVF